MDVIDINNSISAELLQVKLNKRYMKLFDIDNIFEISDNNDYIFKNNIVFESLNITKTLTCHNFIIDEIDSDKISAYNIIVNDILYAKNAEIINFTQLNDVYYSNVSANNTIALSVKINENITSVSAVSDNLYCDDINTDNIYMNNIYSSDVIVENENNITITDPINFRSNIFMNKNPTLNQSFSIKTNNDDIIFYDSISSLTKINNKVEKILVSDTDNNVFVSNATVVSFFTSNNVFANNLICDNCTISPQVNFSFSTLNAITMNLSGLNAINTTDIISSNANIKNVVCTTALNTLSIDSLLTITEEITSNDIIVNKLLSNIIKTDNITSENIYSDNLFANLFNAHTINGNIITDNLQVNNIDSNDIVTKNLITKNTGTKSLTTNRLITNDIIFNNIILYDYDDDVIFIL